MILHTLNIPTEEYEALQGGKKWFVLMPEPSPASGYRFTEGDILYLVEWHTVRKENTGRMLWTPVTYVLRGAPGIEAGYCIVSFAHITEIA